MADDRVDPHQRSAVSGGAGPQAAPARAAPTGDAPQRGGLVRELLIALQFFTRIPVTGRLADWVGFSPALLRASAAHFPAVGWVVGGLSALVLWGLLQALPAQPAAAAVAAVLATVFSVWLTGAFHEDGLADTADGLGGMVSRERALEIMKDSRIGSYGAATLVLALLTKVLLLALLAQAGGAAAAAWALFAAHVSSRLMPLFVIRSLPHVGDLSASKSKPLADSIGTRGLVIALLWWLPALALAAWASPGLPWALAVLGALLGMAAVWRLLQRRLQGFTGDGLGATQQVSELAFYLGLALAL